MSDTTSGEVRAVVFDLGNVLLYFDYGILIRKLAPFCNLDEAGLHRLINQSPLLYQFETGLLTNDQFFEAVSAEAGYTGSRDQFDTAFGNIFRPEERMIELNRRLRRAGIKTYIFSNTNDIAVTHIRAAYPFFAEFDGWIFSHEAKSMKPDARIYELLERESGLSGARLLYIDDRKENIDAGAARGWQVVWHQDVERTLAAVAV